MRALFLDPAARELEAAVAYYNAECPGLGFEFAASVKKTLARILANPDAWQALSARTRRCRVSRFPYGVIYQKRADCILVVAVMHLRRHPDHWKDRASPDPVESF